MLGWVGSEALFGIGSDIATKPESIRISALIVAAAHLRQSCKDAETNRVQLSYEMLTHLVHNAQILAGFIRLWF